MTTRLRTLLAATAATVALAALAGPSWGQAPPADEPRPTEAPEQDPAPAQEVHSWALAPASTDPGQPERPYLSYEAAPGATIHDAVTVFNLSNVQLTFRVYASDAFNNDDGGFDVLPGDEAPTGAGSWVRLAQENLTVPARTQATVPITIEVPVGARPGDHAAAVLASSAAEGTGPDGRVVTLDRRTGTRLYVRVAGPVSPSVSIERLAMTYTHSLNPLGGTAKVRYRVQNTGNVRLAVTHQVSVGGPAGLGAQRGPQGELAELLPGDGATITTELDSVPAAGLAIAEAQVEAVPIGRGDGQDGARAPETRRSMALAPPLTVVAVALAALLALYARRALQRHRGEEGLSLRDQPT